MLLSHVVPRTRTATILAVLLPAVVSAQDLQWRCDEFDIHISTSVKKWDPDMIEVLCEDVDEMAPSVVMADSTYAASSFCEQGGNADASVFVDGGGRFAIDGSADSWPIPYADLCLALVTFETSFAFTVAHDALVAIDFYVRSSGSADRDFQFALEGPAGVIAEHELSPSAWSDIHQDYTLGGELRAGELYRLTFWLHFDAWDHNYGLAEINEFRYGGSVPVREESWGQLKSVFRSRP